MEGTAELSPAPIRSSYRCVRRAEFSVLGVAAAGTLAAIAWTNDAVNVPWHIGSIIGIVAATVVACRRPDHPLTGWFCVMVSMTSLVYVWQDLLRLSLERSTTSWAPATLTLALQITTAVTIVAAIRVFVRFPDGFERDSVERRSVRAVDAVQGIACLAVLLAAEVALPDFIDAERIDNPIGVWGLTLDPGVVSSILGVSQVVVLVGLAMLVRRYRRSNAADRQRMRWLLLPLVGAAFGGAIQFLFVRGSDHAIAITGLAVSTTLVVGIAVGIVRPTGINPDVVLRRSVLWGLVWMAIATVYVTVSAGLGVTASTRWSAGWAVSMTVLTMLALQPVRSRIERVLNRRMFGPPPDPHRVIAQLGASLANTYDLDALLPQIAGVLEDGLGVEWAQVRLMPGAGSDGREPALVVPIELEGEEVGVVECGPRIQGIITRDDDAVVTTLARQAAMAVRNVRLASQLRERSDELSASRARLVRAEEAERRRIERDIHDGAQQQLAALIADAGVIRRRLQHAPSGQAASVVDEVSELQRGLQRILTELRELASGIHPSVLRDRGLLTAVETLAMRHPVPVDVRADPGLRSRRLPAEVEAAGYYTVAEALTNSLKHSGACHVEVDLDATDRELSISIVDDGAGFETAQQRRGNGLANLADRVAAVEGRLRIDSQPGGGTTVNVTFPTERRSTTGDSQ